MTSGAKVVVALLNGQHGAQNLIARFSPLCYQGAICYLFSTKPIKLHEQHKQNDLRCRITSSFRNIVLQRVPRSAGITMQRILLETDVSTPAYGLQMD